MTWTRSAVRNAFLCLLATNKPVHLINNNPLDLVHGEISDFTSNEKHHIFPRAFLDRSGPVGAELHSLPNFCFLPAELNKRISDSEPAKYFKQFDNENSKFVEAAKTHLIQLGQDLGIYDNDYLKFQLVRGRLIIEEIERLCGTRTAPGADQRQQTIERMENRIRDCIHAVLSESFGKQYWIKNIPQSVREGVEQRVESEIKKNPDRQPADFESPRIKLNYCNIMDYLTIIENRANWQYFENIFRRKNDLQRHLESFNEYRNVVMHSREMTELVRMAGETALVWLETVLSVEGDEDTEYQLEIDYA